MSTDYIDHLLGVITRIKTTHSSRKKKEHHHHHHHHQHSSRSSKRSHHREDRHNTDHDRANPKLECVIRVVRQHKSPSVQPVPYYQQPSARPGQFVKSTTIANNATTNPLLVLPFQRASLQAATNTSSVPPISIGARTSMTNDQLFMNEQVKLLLAKQNEHQQKMDQLQQQLAEKKDRKKYKVQIDKSSLSGSSSSSSSSLSSLRDVSSKKSSKFRRQQQQHRKLNARKKKARPVMSGDPQRVKSKVVISSADEVRRKDSLKGQSTETSINNDDDSSIAVKTKAQSTPSSVTGEKAKNYVKLSLGSKKSAVIRIVDVAAEKQMQMQFCFFVPKSGKLVIAKTIDFPYEKDWLDESASEITTETPFNTTPPPPDDTTTEKTPIDTLESTRLTTVAGNVDTPTPIVDEAITTATVVTSREDVKVMMSESSSSSISESSVSLLSSSSAESESES